MTELGYRRLGPCLLLAEPQSVFSIGGMELLQSRMVGSWDLIIPNKTLCLVGSTGRGQGSVSLAAL